MSIAKCLSRGARQPVPLIVEKLVQVAGAGGLAGGLVAVLVMLRLCAGQSRGGHRGSHGLLLNADIFLNRVFQSLDAIL
jgi:hypothetical protein